MLPTLLGLALAAPGAAAQWTVVLLHPAGATDSRATGVWDGEQVGFVMIDGQERACMWTGSAESWVNLRRPVESFSRAYTVSSGGQAGFSAFGGRDHAILWKGGPDDPIDLSPLPMDSSHCNGMWGSHQVGWVHVRSALGTSTSPHASLWSGTAASWVDLHPVQSGQVASTASGVFGDQQVGWVHGRGAALWIGTAESWVDLHPPGYPTSFAYSVYAGRQVGTISLSTEVFHAAIWSGSAASMVDLNPPGASLSIARAAFGTLQAGTAVFGPRSKAVLWAGTAASWIDLHAHLPAHYSDSGAVGLWTDQENTYVVGSGRNSGTGRVEALMWIGPAPVSACEPDLTTTAIAGQPGYGVPDARITDDDFYYYLGHFASGNLGVADLTAGGIPGQPGYGTPNGVINNEDFFFYLTLFAAGCE